eukprot:TRINITY_DN4134_c0_g1_i4.p1 TRINITY_DN4134_c0_g1~~TRINITY_DN4134_c0_g1_i4.p1  ORF type:complete len:341 (-),score=121.76 TRINITY_DN4134_c0_g1_i4:261-1220(-)
MSTPPFSLDKPRFDQSTYIGRLKHMLQITNPLTLLTTDTQLQQSIELLKAFEEKKLPAGVTDEQLWKAKSLRDAIIHPDTGKKIFWPCRMSAFMLTNLPITYGMLTSSTFGSTVFFQWLNQSYNVAVNHANRNASNEMSTTQIMQAYSAAVATSCGIAVSLGHLTKNTKNRLIPLFVPFIAVASAGGLNAFLMRRNEMDQGIIVKDAEGNDRGVSKVAGKTALQQVVATRMVLPAPVLLIPAFAMKLFQSTAMVQRNPRLNLPLQLFSVACSLQLGLPLAVALFPQVSSIPVSQMEPHFQGLKDSKGQPITDLFYNKGL